MYLVRRLRTEAQEPVGGVIELDSVVRQIELVPKFGKDIDPDMNSNNVLDIGNEYYINSFFDREVFKAVY